MKRTRADKIFDAINVVLLTLLTFIMIYPLYFTIIASLSDQVQVQAGNVILWPQGITFDSYINVFSNQTIWIGYRNSIIYTVVATIYGVGMTIFCAYALSRPILKGKNIINLFFIFTMYFGGGLIPSYMLIKSLGLINSFWVMIIPNGMSVYNMIITRTYYRTNVSLDIYEAAKIDGASEYRFFFQIAIPLSGAIIAVMCLYTGVGMWNSWFGGLLYVTDPRKYPLALILRTILTKMEELIIARSSTRGGTATSSSVESVEDALARIENERMQAAMRYALIFVSSAPVLIAYPFVQKYFVKGVLVGSVKG